MENSDVGPAVGLDASVEAVQQVWLDEGYDLYLERDGIVGGSRLREIAVQTHDGRDYSFAARDSKMDLMMDSACARDD